MESKYLDWLIILLYLHYKYRECVHDEPHPCISKIENMLCKCYTCDIDSTDYSSSWTDTQGKQHKLRIVQNICPKWREIRNLLNISDSLLESILSQYHGDLEDCCYAVLIQWLDNGSPIYPLTWEGLLELLNDIDCSQVADDLRDALGLSTTQPVAV